MKQILICEDDDEIIELAIIVLQLYGYKVSVLKTCDLDIREKVKKLQPDLILMDLWIPHIGGESAIAQLKADPLTHDIPVIVFSACNNAKEIAKRVNAEGCITKPFSIHVLEETISSVLKTA